MGTRGVGQGLPTRQHLFLGDGEEVGACAQEAGFGFHGAGNVQQLLPGRVVLPAVVEVRNQPAGAFDTVDPFDGEAYLGNLLV